MVSLQQKVRNLKCNPGLKMCYNDHALLFAVSATMGKVPQKVHAAMWDHPETSKTADSDGGQKLAEPNISPDTEDDRNISPRHYACDVDLDMWKPPPADCYCKATWLGYNRLDPEEMKCHVRDLKRVTFVPCPSMCQPAVRSKAPRHDNNDPRPNATETAENDPTTVRSPAPRRTLTTTKHTRTSPYRPRPLHTIVVMINIITCLFHNGDDGVEPCSPPVNNTKLTTYITNTTNDGQGNGGVEHRSPPGTRTPTTVWLPAPCPWHHSDYITLKTTPDPTNGPDQQLGHHSVSIKTPLRLQPRECQDTALSHCTPPTLSPTHPAWYRRLVIVRGAGPLVCLPATGSVKGIKNALHHQNAHPIPPRHLQRLYHHGQPLTDDDSTPTTGHGPIDLTLRLMGPKGGGRP